MILGTVSLFDLEGMGELIPIINKYIESVAWIVVEENSVYYQLTPMYKIPLLLKNTINRSCIPKFGTELGFTQEEILALTRKNVMDAYNKSGSSQGMETSSVITAITALFLGLEHPHFTLTMKNSELYTYRVSNGGCTPHRKKFLVRITQSHPYSVHLIQLEYTLTDQKPRVFINGVGVCDTPSLERCLYENITMLGKKVYKKVLCETIRDNCPKDCVGWSDFKTTADAHTDTPLHTL